VSKKLPSREQALKLLKENHCPSKVVLHCKAVAYLAVKTAKACQRKGFNVNVDLVEIGALLHDLGRSKTHSVDHVIAGVELAKTAKLPDSVINIIKSHIGGGITKEEADKLGWPKGNYMPITLEEKIVSYADKLVETSNCIVPIEITIKKLNEENLEAVADRVRKIHDEVSQIVESP
jgi:uncharacterized protein